jgi:AraC-like DNA-binding protein
MKLQNGLLGRGYLELLDFDHWRRLLNLPRRYTCKLLKCVLGKCIMRLLTFRFLGFANIYTKYANNTIQTLA